VGARARLKEEFVQTSHYITYSDVDTSHKHLLLKVAEEENYVLG
jgi:hypothetical protein